jgi:hypothetical protein
MHTSSSSSSKTVRKGSHSERRADRRHEVDLLMNRFLNGYPYLSRASDISRTGMRLHPISGGRSSTRFVGLQFQLPGVEDVVTAAGEIVSSPKDGPLGVRFTRMPAVSAARLGRFLATQSA